MIKSPANTISGTMRKLFRAAQTIINTQRKISPGEQEALDYMVKRFNIPVV